MLDMFSPELRRNPFSMYQMMRKAQPVIHIKPADVWMVFRYEDVHTVLSDHTRFSSQYGNVATPDESASTRARMGSSLITTDPPRHTQLRTLVNRAFTPRAVAALEPRIQIIADELLDKVVKSGNMDFVKDFSYPLPVIVIAEMLGIPSEDRNQFKDWSDEVVASADNFLGGGKSSDRAHAEMSAYFSNVIKLRRHDPQDDLISALLAAEVDNEHLTEHDILSLCWLLLVAGNETTTNLIGNAMLTLLEHPDDMTRVRSSPELLPLVIEETLRYRSPIQAMFRITTQEVELSGRKIPAHSRMIASIGSANHDEAKFAEPERFNILRQPNAHIAFGHGVHFCLGAPLARLEARVGLNAVLQRLNALSRIDDAPLEPCKGFIVHGVASLPLQFSPSR